MHTATLVKCVLFMVGWKTVFVDKFMRVPSLDA